VSPVQMENPQPQQPQQAQVQAEADRHTSTHKRATQQNPEVCQRAGSGRRRLQPRLQAARGGAGAVKTLLKLASLQAVSRESPPVPASPPAPASPAPRQLARRRRALPRPRPGIWEPDDPFFWFAQNLKDGMTAHSYPAVYLPQQLGTSATNCFTVRYTDFVSRTSTPEPERRHQRSRSRSVSPGRHADGTPSTDQAPVAVESWEPTPDNIGGAQCPTRPVPPSICVVQPTEMARPRTRWEVSKEFVDDQEMLLGDQGWFPGAGGHRFNFEANTDDVSLFVRLGVVPQAQLLYMWAREVRRGPREDGAGVAQRPQAVGGARGRAEARACDENSPCSSDIDESAALRSSRRDQQRKLQQLGEFSGAPDKAMSLMLPPTLFRSLDAF